MSFHFFLGNELVSSRIINQSRIPNSYFRGYSLCTCEGNGRLTQGHWFQFYEQLADLGVVLAFEPGGGSRGHNPPLRITFLHFLSRDNTKHGMKLSRGSLF